MSRYIDIEPYEKDGWYLQRRYRNSYGESIITTPLASIPTAEPVKHGRWWHYEGTLTCSVCHTEIYDDIMELLGDDVPRCCPNCGAKMDGTNKSVESVDLGNGFSISVNKSQVDTQGRYCPECLYSPTCYGAGIDKPACKAFVPRVRYVDVRMDGGENG